MRGARGHKDPSIRVFLERLADSGYQWELQDHWEGDLCAVGVSRPGDPGRLAYVSTWGQPSGRYHVELEVPASAQDVYETTRVVDSLTLAAAVEMVGEHLAVNEAT